VIATSSERNLQPLVLIKGASTMACVAMIAARICARSVPESPNDETVGSKRPWHRPPRTKAALAIKAAAIQKVLEILERSNVEYTQPLVGKFVIDPRPGVAGGGRITFWPARGRLRIGRHPTKNHGILAFQQALADQGYLILGYLSRSKPARPSTVSKAERLRARQEANLSIMAHAHAQRVAFFRQTLADDGHGIRTRDPRSARVRRLFRCAWLRAV
jgi:hypothetical protein